MLPPPALAADMNTALSDTLLQACVKPTLLPNKFVLEHMALVAALNVRVGSEVGEWASGQMKSCYTATPISRTHTSTYRFTQLLVLLIL